MKFNMEFCLRLFLILSEVRSLDDPVQDLMRKNNNNKKKKQQQQQQKKKTTIWMGTHNIVKRS